MTMRGAVLTLCLVAAASAHAGTIVKVEGRIVDRQGKPVEGARIAETWYSDDGHGLQAASPTVSGKDGRFSLELELYDRDTLVMAMNAGETEGGVATVLAKSPSAPLEISLAPLVETRVRYASESAGRSLGRAFIAWSVAGTDLNVAVGRSRNATFAMKLPPGHYTLRGSESRHLEDVREIRLEPGKAADLGPIALPLAPLSKLFGKPAPAWHVTDARGVSKDVQPADFKGKWVVLEFWGFWCGPCTQRGLPGWMDFFDDHAADSDKFVILAVHDPQATDFTMLDEKLAPIIRRTWRGRALPFPILLDTSGRFVNDYGVPHWPTAIIIDPEGRVVDVPEPGMKGTEDFLASKLTPIPVEKRIARALDRALSLGVDEGQTLAGVLEFYADVSSTRIHLDRDEIQAAKIAPETHLPLRVSGALTLRAWLNLTLEPFGLTYVGDGDGLRVVRRTADNTRLAQPSSRQNAENVLVADALQNKVSLEFRGESLKQALALLESTTHETFLIDPACRMARTIDPERQIAGSISDEPLSSALARLLTPLGLTLTVRNEAVILTTVP